MECHAREGRLGDLSPPAEAAVGGEGRAEFEGGFAATAVAYVPGEFDSFGATARAGVSADARRTPAAGVRPAAASRDNFHQPGSSGYVKYILLSENEILEQLTIRFFQLYKLK